MGVIYLITNPKNKIYVGQTTNYETRIKKYRWLNCSKQRKLHNSFLKYGFECHEFKILEDNIPNELLNEREIYWIAELKSYYKENEKYGMNLNKGGNTPIWDKCRKESFSEKFKGERNPFYGKTHSLETRLLYSRNTKEQMRKSGYRITKESREIGLNKIRRTIAIYNKEGDLFKTFNSLQLCADYLGVTPSTIKDSMKSNGFVKGKYACRYFDITPKQKIEVRLYTNERPVIAMTSDYEIICEHESAISAAAFWGMSKRTIQIAAGKKPMIPLSKGHVFVYKDIYNKILQIEQSF